MEMLHVQLGSELHRYIGARIGPLGLIGLYFALNNQKKPLFDALCKLGSELLEQPTILLGDFNTGLHYEDEVGRTFFCADSLKMLHDIGWHDVWRKRNPQRREYSWVSRSGAGNGFRIDHLLATSAAEKLVTAIEYLHEDRKNGTSDHSMLVAEISVPAAGLRRSSRTLNEVMQNYVSLPKELDFPPVGREVL